MLSKRAKKPEVWDSGWLPPCPWRCCTLVGDLDHLLERVCPAFPGRASGTHGRPSLAGWPGSLLTEQGGLAGQKQNCSDGQKWGSSGKSPWETSQKEVAAFYRKVWGISF